MRLPHRRFAFSLSTLLALAACSSFFPSADKSPGPERGARDADSARLAGVRPGPKIASLGLRTIDAEGALSSFRESCPKLLRREDISGLTFQADWAPACKAALDWPTSRSKDFFKTHFETAVIGSGDAFATGYFEPEIAGCRTKRADCNTPIYRMPSDLVRGWPADMPERERTGRPRLGRYDASGDFVLYYERAEIEAGALAGRDLEIAYAVDPVELFFLHIQGSGRVRTPSGEVIRIGYAGQNGREYVGIGAVMRRQGLLGDGPGQYASSMQGIMQYIRENRVEGQALMRMNKSWIFFRELKGDGPLGALGVPVRAMSSVAADPRFVPLGAPVWLDLDNDRADGMWIAQDTGGAIKGANRFDTFWGAGQDARTTAGGMSANGEAVIFLPKGTLGRLRQK